MKIILFGATGTVGKNAYAALKSEKNEIIKVGRKTGDYKVQIEDPDSITELYKKVGNFDAVVSAVGEVAFTPLSSIKGEDLKLSVSSKLLGQINLVLKALPYINEKGSFTLISGVLGKEQIYTGCLAATVNGALENFVKSASLELPKELRINIVSPTLLEDAVAHYGDYFPGFIPVSGEKVGQAFKKSVMGVQTGKVFEVF